MAAQEDKPEAPAKDKLITPLGIVVDLALAGLFFMVFTLFILPPHVPAFQTGPLYFFSAYTALCLTGVFWIGLQLFRVTYARQKLDRQKVRS